MSVHLTASWNKGETVEGKQLPLDYTVKTPAYENRNLPEGNSSLKPQAPSRQFNGPSNQGNQFWQFGLEIAQSVVGKADPKFDAMLDMTNDDVEEGSWFIPVECSSSIKK